MTTHPEDSPEVAAQRKAFESWFRTPPGLGVDLKPLDADHPFWSNEDTRLLFDAFQAGAAWQREQDK